MPHAILQFHSSLYPHRNNEESASGIKIIPEKTQDNFLVDFPPAEVRGKRQIIFCTFCKRRVFLHRQIAVKLEIATRLQHESH